jgi:hypothetical protein
VVQDSGGYSTGFTITLSVTIDAAGFNASVISMSATDLCIINAGATDRVVLRGISFHGASVGPDAIPAEHVGSLYVEHCSIAEFAGDGISTTNAGNVFVTGTDMRRCATGIRVETNGSTAANLIAHDSRITECDFGVSLFSVGTGDATGWLSNCTASRCLYDGFLAEAFNTNSGDVALTLADCRSVGNSAGIGAIANGTGNVTVTLPTP